MSIQKPASFPSEPGVYQFKKAGRLLYIGKAADLKKRLSFYFRKNAGEKIRRLREEATSLVWTQTLSEIEAFIKEAELIKKYHPRYNVLMRDDKNYFFVGITREEFPRIFITHQPRKELNARFIGPFTSGGALTTTLKLLRRTFPYCTCKTSHKRPCLNSQIGRCPGFCCLKMSTDNSFAAQEYQKTVKCLRAILEGKNKILIKNLKKLLQRAVAEERFEEAAKIRDQLIGIENIFEHKRLLGVTMPRHGQTIRWPHIEHNLRLILKSHGPAPYSSLGDYTGQIARVEGYDISHISGTESTGSMVVFYEGKPLKSAYRKFRIKTVHQISDVDMLKEVIARRLNHPEWPYPELMLIDGGKAQLNTVHSVITSYHLPRIISGKALMPLSTIKIAALAKRKEELYIPHRKNPIPIVTLPSDVASFLKHVRDESHRFAKKYHHKLREISYRL